jgi:hypothetical protein
MLQRARNWSLALLCLSVVPLCACQSPTTADSTSFDVDDFVDATVSPDPAVAVPSTGKTYRVVRGNNQPDDILEYDWKTSFTVTITLNSNATSEDVDLSFPVAITAATARVEQATGGIVSPPSGGESDHYESLITQTSSNKFSAAETSVTMAFDVWYDLPSLRKEALITITIAFRDDDGVTFSKTVTVQVSP